MLKDRQKHVQVPWTELFRPRSLSEVILTKSQRDSIVKWWRAWVCLWNLKVLWIQKYYSSWREFIGNKENRRLWQRHKNSWYEHFLGTFEKWLGNPEVESKIFQQGSIADIKKTAKPVLERFLEDVWISYISDKKSEGKEALMSIMYPMPPYKPLLLVGPPGSGKTTTAYALANDEGVYVVEFNASDERSRAAVRRVIKEASMSAGFFIWLDFPQKPPRLLLLDEVDGMSSQRDKGGFQALLKLLEDIKIPPILTANILHDPKVRQLFRYCISVFFDRPMKYQAEALIKRIASTVKMDLPDDVVDKLTKYATDFRSIVLALETYYYSGKLPTLWHDRMTSLQDSIRFAFGLKSSSGKLEDDINLAKRYLEESGEDIYDLILAVWDNSWEFIKKDEIFGFYKAIADADYYYKIGALKGNWYVAYVNAFDKLAYGMAKYGIRSDYWTLRKKRINIPKLGTQFQKLYQTLAGEGPLGKFVVSLAKYWHTSRRDVIKSIPLIIHFAKTNPDIIGALLTFLGCSQDTVEAFLSEYITDEETRSRIRDAYKRSLKEGHRLKISGKEEVSSPKAAEEKGVEKEKAIPTKKEELKTAKKGTKRKSTKKEMTDTLDQFISKE
ncbi:MAG: AAA family ATPase [Crenarchaeota archaeon]|nr:AAA family ATPase [Thermoproteota archaeon]MCR8454873.1 AAA family ATPase [Thermoproteota archaeon]MCR8501196.1 AAA family ATPase [Thermoproteota archaeon]